MQGRTSDPRPVRTSHFLFLWQRLLSRVLESLGLERVQKDPCVFINDWAIVFFYVDDIAVMFRNKDAEKATTLIDALKAQIQIRDLGDLKWFLGIQVRRDRAAQQLWLSEVIHREACGPFQARLHHRQCPHAIHLPRPAIRGHCVTGADPGLPESSRWMHVPGDHHEN